jgi:hypothetical protein
MVRLHPPGDMAGSWRPAPTLPFGGIVGRARIVDVIVGPSHPARPMASALALGGPWYAGGFALVLADVEALPFVPWRGSLGFFDVPDAVVRAAVERERERLDGARERC